MLSESVRNWLVQLEIEALDKGTDKIEDVTDEEVSEEERKAFASGLAYLKEIKEEIGDKAFSKITIDVGYDY